MLNSTRENCSDQAKRFLTHVDYTRTQGCQVQRCLLDAAAVTTATAATTATTTAATATVTTTATSARLCLRLRL